MAESAADGDGAVLSGLLLARIAGKGPGGRRSRREAVIDLVDGEITVTPKTQQLPLKDSPEDEPELVDA